KYALARAFLASAFFGDFFTAESAAFIASSNFFVSMGVPLCVHLDFGLDGSTVPAGPGPVGSFECAMTDCSGSFAVFEAAESSDTRTAFVLHAATVAPAIRTRSFPIFFIFSLRKALPGL